jgi:uncharacterized membrane protein YoaK (UPF0700 family)
MRHSSNGKAKIRGLSLPSFILRRDALLLLLSLAAGCVDAVSYLGLNRVFTANMSGNTVLLGIALGQMEWQAAMRSGVALMGFVAGLAAGAAIVERGREDVTWPSVVTRGLALECGILVTLAVVWHFTERPVGEVVYCLIGLAALAMGVQSAAVRRLGVGSVATTYVTGTLTSLTRQMVRRLRSSDEEEATSVRDLELPANVWLAYVVGAAVGGIAEPKWESSAILLAIVFVAAVVVAAAVRYRRR